MGRFINADDATYLGINGEFISYNLFAYCLNNSVKYDDQSGKFVFSLFGAVAGYAAGFISAMATGVDSSKWNDVALANAAGGFVAGAGVDIGLVCIGTGGVGLGLLGVGAVFVAGGLGNMFATDKTSQIVNGEHASSDELLGSFIYGGVFNEFSLLTSIGSAGKTLLDVALDAVKTPVNNLLSGLATALSLNISTELGTR